MTDLLIRPDAPTAGTAEHASVAPAPPEAVKPAAPAGAAPLDGRACDACASPMIEGQDWCFACGTAAPGRLGVRHGVRTAAATVAVTLALAGSAVAASYAALSSHAGHEAAGPPPAAGTPVAQVPPAVPPAPIPPVPAADLPTAKAPSVPTPPKVSAPDPAPANPKPTTPVVTPKADAKAGDGKAKGANEPDDSTPATPATAAPVALADDAAALYDPSGYATTTEDPADAVDGDTDTAWKVTSSNASSMNLGLVIDLGKKRGVRELELLTRTPGFRTEIYATDSADVPPDILDTRWAHIKDRSDVGRKERIVLGAGTTKYRYVLFWLTTPPKGGPTVTLTEARVLG
jgi:hypothetical protein